MEKEIFNKIYKEHIKILKNINQEGKKVVICFSAVPASGKTHIAKIIEKKYHAVNLNKDKIGEIIRNLGITQETKEKEDLSYQYILMLLENWPFNNKLVILDKSIDRDYEKIFQILEENGFDKFIIRIEVDKEVMLKRIRERNKENLEAWLVKINMWFQTFEQAKANINADIVVDNNKLDLDELYNKLDSKLS